MKAKHENHFQVIFIWLRLHAVDCLKESQKLKDIKQFLQILPICWVEVLTNMFKQECNFSIWTPLIRSQKVIMRWKVYSFDDKIDLLKSIFFYNQLKILFMNDTIWSRSNQKSENSTCSGVYQPLMLHFLVGLALFGGEEEGLTLPAVGLLNLLGDLFSFFYFSFSSITVWLGADVASVKEITLFVWLLV